jgi:hypothetical protein
VDAQREKRRSAGTACGKHVRRNTDTSLTLEMETRRRPPESTCPLATRHRPYYGRCGSVHVHDIHSPRSCVHRQQTALPLPQQRSHTPRGRPIPLGQPTPPMHWPQHICIYAATCLLLRSNEPAPSLAPASSSFSNGSRPCLLSTPHRGLCALAFMLASFKAKTSLELSTRANSA